VDNLKILPSLAYAIGTTTTIDNQLSYFALDEALRLK
jgi:hypothetical protein